MYPDPRQLWPVFAFGFEAVAEVAGSCGDAAAGKLRTLGLLEEGRCYPDVASIAQEGGGLGIENGQLVLRRRQRAEFA